MAHWPRMRNVAMTCRQEVNKFLSVCSFKKQVPKFCASVVLLPCKYSCVETITTASLSFESFTCIITLMLNMLSLLVLILP